MTAHLRANLWLLVLTVILCCVLYPLAIWGIGQTVFHQSAQGSLLDAEGQPVTDTAKAIGSRLIAQPFTADEYFQPRPSATSPAYNAAASGPSNYAASNYLLRDRAKLPGHAIAEQVVVGGVVGRAGGGRVKGRRRRPRLEVLVGRKGLGNQPRTDGLRRVGNRLALGVQQASLSRLVKYRLCDAPDR
jgi:hypothetical protein